jgi:hypothetical protein
LELRHSTIARLRDKYIYYNEKKRGERREYPKNRQDHHNKVYSLIGESGAAVS